MPDFIDYAQLTQLISKLNAKKVTGTLFLHTPENKSCMLVFRIGVVIGVTFDNLRGKSAIQELRNNDSFSYRFQEGKPPPVRQDLESPEDTLRALGVEVEESPESFDETMVMTSIPEILKGATQRPPAKKAPATPAQPSEPVNTETEDPAPEEPGGLSNTLRNLFRKRKAGD